MPFRDDPRIDRLETLAARLSRMQQAAEIVFARQRGNLRRDDRDEIDEFRQAYTAALAMLTELRRDDPPPPARDDPRASSLFPAPDQCAADRAGVWGEQ